MGKGSRTWLLALVVVTAGIVGFVVVERGSVGLGSMWLDGEPNPASRELAIFIFGGCDHEPGEEVRSLSIDETQEAVIVDLKIRVPLGLPRSCGSEEGMPYVLYLNSPLGDREVLALNPDSSTTPILVSPYAE